MRELTVYEDEAAYNLCSAKWERDKGHAGVMEAPCPSCRAAIVALVDGTGEASVDALLFRLDDAMTIHSDQPDHVDRMSLTRAWRAIIEQFLPAALQGTWGPVAWQVVCDDGTTCTEWEADERDDAEKFAERFVTRIVRPLYATPPAAPQREAECDHGVSLCLECGYVRADAARAGGSDA